MLVFVTGLKKGNSSFSSFCDRALKGQQFVRCPAGVGGSRGVRHGGSGKLKGFQRAAQTSSRPRQTVSCLSEPSGAGSASGCAVRAIWQGKELGRRLNAATCSHSNPGLGYDDASDQSEF